MKALIVLSMSLSFVLLQASAEEQQEATKETLAHCGVISIFHKPPEARDVFSATIHRVDDSHLNSGRSQVKLATGKHIISLHEQIDRKNLLDHGNQHRKAKTIEIEIEANKVYHLGAQLVRHKKLSIYDDEYWHPVIWKTSARDCQLAE